MSKVILKESKDEEKSSNEPKAETGGSGTDQFIYFVKGAINEINKMMNRPTTKNESQEQTLIKQYISKFAETVESYESYSYHYKTFLSKIHQTFTQQELMPLMYSFLRNENILSITNQDAFYEKIISLMKNRFVSKTQKQEEENEDTADDEEEEAIIETNKYNHELVTSIEKLINDPANTEALKEEINRMYKSLISLKSSDKVKEIEEERIYYCLKELVFNTSVTLIEKQLVYDKLVAVVANLRLDISKVQVKRLSQVIEDSNIKSITDKDLENVISKMKGIIQSTNMENVFCHFFSYLQVDESELSDDSNNVNDISYIESLIRSMVIQIGAFWHLADEIGNYTYKRDRSGLLLLNKLASKYDECFMINAYIHDDNDTSLFHHCAFHGIEHLLDLLLTQNIDISILVDKSGANVEDTAWSCAQWAVYRKLLFGKMGNKMKNKAKNEEKRISIKEGISDVFLNNIVDKNSNVLEDIVTEMINLIKAKKPMSDDLLLIAWKYEENRIASAAKDSNIYIVPQENKVNRIQKALMDQLTQALSKKIKKRDFLWFKYYLFDSVVWYKQENAVMSQLNNEMKNDQDNVTTTKTDGNESSTRENGKNGNDSGGGKIMYSKLVDIVNKNETQRNYLKRKINKILRNESFFWNKMINFKEYLVCEETPGLRQDSVLDKNTSQQILKYPIRSTFDYDKLESYNLVDRYNSLVYLSNLIIVANSLNQLYHTTMKNEILSKLPSSVNYKYTAGPLKQHERMVTKSESDYAAKPFPCGAHVLDIIRCTITFDDCKSLITALNHIIKFINKGDTCIKKVLRVKNMFAHSDSIYIYGDIKLNLLLESGELEMGMIVECQLLLSMMLEAKKLGHQLYTIQRNDEFKNDMSKILQVSKDKRDELFYLSQSSVKDAKANEERLARLLNCYSDKLNIVEPDSKGMNVFHYVCQTGNLRLFRILVEFVSFDQLKEAFNQYSNDNNRYLPTHFACENKSLSILRYIIRHFGIKGGAEWENRLIDLGTQTKKPGGSVNFTGYGLLGEQNSQSAVNYILNNEEPNAGDGIDDDSDGTDGIAGAGVILSDIGMELWLDASDETTMIKQVNESTSTDEVSFWLSKTYNKNKRYLCVPKYIPNIRSPLKPYLVNEGVDLEKNINYETVLPIKQPVGIQVNYSHTFEILPAITSIQTVCSFHLFNHYPNSGMREDKNFYFFGSEHDGTFVFHTNGNMKGINTNESWGDFHYNNAHQNLLNGKLSINGNENVIFKHQTHWGDPRIAILECTGPIHADINYIGRERVWHEFSGVIFELIVYNRKLSDDEKLNVMKHFYNKYFLSYVRMIQLSIAKNTQLDSQTCLTLLSFLIPQGILRFVES